jgi:hypothetical protein
MYKCSVPTSITMRNQLIFLLVNRPRGPGILHFKGLEIIFRNTTLNRIPLDSDQLDIENSASQQPALTR